MVRTFVRSAAALALVLILPGTVRAGSDGRVTFGSRWWTQTAPEASFREYLDLSRGGFLESFLLRGWTAEDLAMVTGENALRDDQSTHLRLARGVRWQLDVRDDQIPHLYSLTARTPYTE